MHDFSFAGKASAEEPPAVTLVVGVRGTLFLGVETVILDKVDSRNIVLGFEDGAHHAVVRGVTPSVPWGLDEEEKIHHGSIQLVHDDCRIGLAEVEVVEERGRIHDHIVGVVLKHGLRNKSAVIVGPIHLQSIKETHGEDLSPRTGNPAAAFP